jgi:hypothetical protein
LKSRAEDVLKPRIETVLNPSPDGHLTSIKLCGEVRRAAASANDESTPQLATQQASCQATPQTSPRQSHADEVTKLFPLRFGCKVLSHKSRNVAIS